ncbi:MAG: DUF853 family protein [Spirochaetes bacterium]|nr:DUF853 family protein [Spirochaetota bacterium]
MIIAKAKEELAMLPAMTNRHGLIAGATGTGKTVTLQTIAEGLSRNGVPVFLADVKGDLSGISQPGKVGAKLEERIKTLGLKDHTPEGYPVIFWDIFGQKGHPVRTTVSEMGPMLLSRLLNLNETQEATLTVLFKVADENGLLLLDMKDLKAILQFASENADQLPAEYGRISRASVGTIQRSLAALESEGADRLFGEPALNIDDLLQTDGAGRGIIHLLASDKLIQHPKVYSTFLLWVISELFEQLPEVGDVEKPKLVFIFDEAHLLFDDAPKVLREKIEQVVRLIRSKGVGVYFVTQNPLDIPEDVLGQLGNRVQHALRAFTPKDQKAVRAVAQTFRANPKVDVEKSITELAVGEALVSFLAKDGTPEPVERALVLPPRSQIGAITDEQRRAVIDGSVLKGQYEKEIDRESAFEILKKRAREDQDEAEKGAAKAAPEPRERVQKEPARRGGRSDSFAEAILKSAGRSVASTLGRELVRGLFGSATRRRRRW